MFNYEKTILKYVRVFGCASYVLRLPPPQNLEARAIEGIHLETMEHGTYKVLIRNDNGRYRITESTHVTFDEKSLPRAPDLEEVMDEEVSDDDSEHSNQASELLDTEASDSDMNGDSVDVTFDYKTKSEVDNLYDHRERSARSDFDNDTSSSESNHKSNSNDSDQLDLDNDSDDSDSI